MTPEEFHSLVWPYNGYIDKGKPRLKRILRAYEAYVAAYRVLTLKQLCYYAINGHREATLLAAQHRDEGVPRVRVSEFERMIAAKEEQGA